MWLQDLLEDKIRAGRYKLEDYFPGFVDYMIPPEADSELQSGADREFVRAKYFIRDNFLQISQQERASELDLIQLFKLSFVSLH